MRSNRENKFALLRSGSTIAAPNSRSSAAKLFFNRFDVSADLPNCRQHVGFRLSRYFRQVSYDRFITRVYVSAIRPERAAYDGHYASLFRAPPWGLVSILERCAAYAGCGAGHIAIDL